MVNAETLRTIAQASRAGISVRARKLRTRNNIKSEMAMIEDAFPAPGFKYKV